MRTGYRPVLFTALLVTLCSVGTVEPLELGDDCTIGVDYECHDTVEHSECGGAFTPVCVCTSSYKEDNGICIPKVIGDECADPGDCDYDGGGCNSGTCGCDHQTHADIDRICKPKLGTFCPDDDSCQDVTEHSKCRVTVFSPVVCECIPGYAQARDMSSVCLRDCGNLDLPNNGDVQPISGIEGEIVVYTCITGFKLEGLPERICQVDGKWSDQAPICIPKAIDDPCAVDDECLYDNGQCDEEAGKCDCDPGHTADQGQCKRECVDLLHPDFGQVQYRVALAGEMATYSCDIGNKLDGTSERTCGIDGIWSGEEPSCILKELNDPCSGDNDCPYANGACDLEEGFCGCGQSYDADQGECKKECEDLLSPESGQVEYRVALAGEVATYSCDIGNKLDGISQRTCAADGIWSGEEPLCILKELFDPCSDNNDCPYANGACVTVIGICICDLNFAADQGECKRECEDLLSPVSGQVQYRVPLAGEVATYSCDIGNKLNGTSQRTCGADGIWTGEQPSCILKELNDPCSGDNDCPYANGACEGICTCDQSFAADVGECKRECDELLSPESGQVQYRVALAGEVATYSCDIGNKLDGTPQRTCGADGIWTGDQPSCILKELNDTCSGINDCPYANGECDQVEGICTCDQSFAADLGECKKECEDLLHPESGLVQYRVALAGEVATYSCDIGNKLDGASQRTCGANGIWTGEQPSCILKELNDLCSGDNDCPYANGACDQVFGTCSCDQNFAADQGECKRECEDLLSPAAGLVQYRVALAEEVANYSCGIGNKLNGPSQRTCGIDGIWTGEQPSCILKVIGDVCKGDFDCPYPFSACDTSQEPGQCDCTTGYDVIGLQCRPRLGADCESDADCQSLTPNSVCHLEQSRCVCAQNFVREEETCVQVCLTVPPLENGIVVPEGTTEGSTAKVSCDDGYRLHGGRILQCVDGEWTGIQPVCIRRELNDPCSGDNDCPYANGACEGICTCDQSFAADVGECKRECEDLPHPDFGKVEYRVALAGEVATYSCDIGNKLDGASQRTCGIDGSWAGEKPSCILKELNDPCSGDNDCPYANGACEGICTCDTSFAADQGECKRECDDLLHPVSGQVQYRVALAGEVANYSCDIGNKLDGPSQRTCGIDGIWSGEQPSCIIKELNDTCSGDNDCPYANGACDPLFGTCSCDQNFAADLGECKGECDDLPHPDFGKVQYRVALAGEVATYSCDIGNKLDGSSQRTCGMDGIWSGEEPSCILKVIGDVCQGDFDCPYLFSACDSTQEPGQCGCTTGYDAIGLQCRPHLGYECQGHAECQSLTPNSVCHLEQRLCVCAQNFVREGETCVQVCLTVPTLDNGEVVPEGTTEGSTATVTCDLGYRLHGGRILRCSSGQWTGVQPVCIERVVGDVCQGDFDCPYPFAACDTSQEPGQCDCTTGYDVIGLQCRPQCLALPAFENGSVMQGGTSEGSTTTYTCSIGYRLDGNSLRECLDGDWTGVQPFCVRNVLGDDCRENGDCATTNNAICSNKNICSCDNNYEDTTGEEPGGECHLVCERPQQLQNGEVTYQDGVFVGNTASFTCNIGFRLIGSSTLVCLPSGLWDEPFPNCQQGCPQLEAVPNAQYDSSQKYPGESVEYLCDPDFVLVGSMTLTCSFNAEWNSNPPACMIDCGELTDPDGGSVEYSETFEGSGATYVCNRGYRLSGTNMATCLASGLWSAFAPDCINKVIGDDCQTKLDCLYLYSACDTFNKCGCSEGFEDVDGLCKPYLGSQCQSDEDCQPLTTNSVCDLEQRRCVCAQNFVREGETCVQVCLTIPELDNGEVVPDGTTEGSTATVTCDDGYRLDGALVLQCVNGVWAGIQPLCVRRELGDDCNKAVDCVTISNARCNETQQCECQENYADTGNEPVGDCQPACPRPPGFPNGDIEPPGDSFIGQTATFKCAAGYTLLGSSTLTCLLAGIWDAPFPICQPSCDDLNHPANGRVTVTGTSVGSSATYKCDEGYHLEGDAERTCTSTRAWTGTQPQCIINNCGIPENIANGNVDFTETTVGRTAVYFCDDQYLLQGEPVRECGADSKWQGVVPVCTTKRLGDPCEETAECEETPNSVCIDSVCACSSGFVDNKPNEFGGQCIAECPILAPILNGQVDMSQKYEADTVTYTCDGEYRLDGARVVECLSSGTWSEIPPVCLRECPLLERIANGDVDTSQKVEGESVTYTCDQGYDRIGAERLVCQSSGLWDAGPPECKLRCPLLRDVPNANYDGAQKYAGQSVEYECNVAYVLVGSSTLTCSFNGVWNSDPPYCMRDCGDLTDPAHGRVEYERTLEQSVATYVCDAGYRLNRADTRMCLTNGSWSDTTPHCISKVVGDECQTNFDCLYQYSACDTVNKRCDCSEGYEPVEDVCKPYLGYECQTDEDCLALNPNSVCNSESSRCECAQTFVQQGTTCIRECPSLPTFQNGNMVLDDLSEGSNATFTCHPGYRLDGGSVLQCLNGMWTGIQPLCVKRELGDDCEDPFDCATITHAICNNESNKCTCGENYKDTTGDQHGGECQFACPPPQRPVNGRVDHSGSAFVGETATFTCNVGYKLLGRATLTCLTTGIWDAAFPICQLSCDDLDDPANGRVTVTGTSVGSSATYTCLEGYHLEGNAERTCTSTRAWTGTQPRCIINNCGIPGSIDNGDVSYTATIVGSNAVYTCDSQYLLQGDPVWECSVDGQWQGTVPPFCTTKQLGDSCDDNRDCAELPNSMCLNRICACLPGYMDSNEDSPAGTCRRTCPPPQQPINGGVDRTGSAFVGETATFTCNFGYTLLGSATLTCLTTGMWDAAFPICQLSCDGLDDPDNGRVTVSGTSVGSSATYTCDEGYHLEGDGERTCTSTRAWTGTQPQCIINNCGIPGSIENGDVSYTETIVGSTAVYTCDSQYLLQGDPVWECGVDGQWQGTVSPFCTTKQLGDSCDDNRDCADLPNSMCRNRTCACLPGYMDSNEDSPAGTCRRTCPPPQRPVNGRVDHSGSAFVGETATFTCDFGYTLLGRATLTCLTTGGWDAAFPICQLSCDDLDDPANGRVTVTGTSVGSSATYTCDEGYHLEGDAERTCTSTRAWTGTQPQCIINNCGFPGTIENGDVSFTETIVGSTATYSCDSQYLLQGDPVWECGVDGQWQGTIPPFCTTKQLGDGCDDDRDCADLRSSMCLNEMCVCLPGYVDSNGEDPAGTCRRNCFSPPNVANAMATYTMTTEGSKANYTCDDGYKSGPNGGHTLVCGSSGDWEGNLAECLDKDCGLPPPIDNGLSEYDTTTVGSTAGYVCDPGYIFQTIQNPIRCDDSEVWIGTLPACVKSRLGDGCSENRDCADIPHSTCRNGICACLDGYMDSTENIPGGECRINCFSPPNVANAMATYTMTTEGSKANYTCGNGYKFGPDGNHILVCSSSGDWEGNLAECLEKDCGPPPAIDNGLAEYDTTTVGSMAGYVCLSGYIFQTILNPIRCDDSEVWIGTLPTCVKSRLGDGCTENLDCADIPHSTCRNEICACLDGYVDSTENIPGGECRINCFSPPIVSNAMATYTMTTEGSKANYTCDDGYKFEPDGDHTLMCDSTGDWEGNLAECLEKDCGPPPDIDNGLPEYDTTTVGSMAVYVCRNGYIFQTIQNPIRCEESEVWIGTLPTCVKSRLGDGCTENHDCADILDSTCRNEICACLDGYVDSNENNPGGECRINCYQPPDIDNAEVEYTTTTLGSTARYICSERYRIQTGGDDQLVCNELGVWGGNLPTCIEKRCSSPPDIANGEPVYTSTTVGSTVSYICIPGFTFRSDEAPLTCDDSQSWAGNTPSCVETRLGDRCNDGDACVNLPFSECTNDFCTCLVGYADSNAGNLGGECSRDCFVPPDIDNAEVNYTTTTLGSTAKYDCIDGYTFGTGVIRQLVCIESGGWVGDRSPCIEKRCDDPPRINNGRAVFSSKTVGSTASYTCVDGYVLQTEEGLLTCDDSETWSGTVPACVKTRLGDKCSDNRDCADLLHSECQGGLCMCLDGYIDSNEGDVGGECRALCRVLANPANGVVSTTGTTEGSTAEYDCDLGFHLEGSVYRLCENSGSWSGAEPTCNVNECAPPPLVPNGRVIETHTSSIVEYECLEGYVLDEEESVLVCNGTGSWEGTVPSCVKTRLGDDCSRSEDCAGIPNSVCRNSLCSCTDDYIDDNDDVPAGECKIGCPLEEINNGIVDLTPKYEGQTVVFSCLPGYILVGNNILTCLPSGEWDSVRPVCRKGCIGLAAPENGAIDREGNVYEGQDVEFNCDEGFVLLGRKILSCEKSGAWSHQSPLCAKACPELVIDSDVNVEMTFELASGQQALFSCNQGYILDGGPTLTCLDTAQWSGEIPTCVRDFSNCPILEPPLNGFVSVRRETATYSCGDNYSLVGDRVRVCHTSGFWNGSRPLCLIKCPPFVSPFQVSKGSAHHDGEEVSFSCPPGQIIVGNPVITCKDSGLWSSSPPTCLKPTSSPTFTFQFKPFNQTSPLDIQEIIAGLLDDKMRDSDVVDVRAEETGDDGTINVTVELGEEEYQDEDISDLGKDFIDTVKPLKQLGVAGDPSMSIYDTSVMVDGSCFWYKHLGVCVQLGLCVKKKGQVLCKCEETDCTPLYPTSLAVMPFTIGAVLCCFTFILLLGGVHYHRRFGSTKVDESDDSGAALATPTSILPRLVTNRPLGTPPDTPLGASSNLWMTISQRTALPPLPEDVYADLTVPNPFFDHVATSVYGKLQDNV